MTFVEWLKTQKDKRTNTGRIARICFRGQESYGFKFETEEDILLILKSFNTKGGCFEYVENQDLMLNKYLPKARQSYQKLIASRILNTRR